MPSAARRGAQAETQLPAVHLVERALDRTIEYLVERAPVPESKALLIEARRLRGVVANWSSIAPSEDAYRDMVQRTLTLSQASGASLYDPAYDLREQIDPFIMVEEASIVDPSEDPEAYLVDFEPHLYSLSVIAPAGRAARVQVPATKWSAFPPPLAPSDAGGAREGDARPEQAPPPRPVGRASEQAPPLLRVVASPEPSRPRSEPPPPEKKVRSYPPEVFDGPDGYPADEGDLAYPRVPQLTTSSFTASGEPELVYPSLPPVERGTTGMLRPIHLSGRAVTGVADLPAIERDRRGSDRPPAIERSRTLRPLPELALDAPGPAAEEEALAPQTEIKVVQLKKPENVDPHIVMIADPYSERADVFRALRRKLASLGFPRVMLVTSAAEGDGKTVAAINLAVALREGIRGNVLLIDVNLRSPGLSKALGFDPPECFDAQIARHQEDPLAPWVVAELMPQLHVLALDPSAEHEPLFDAITFTSSLARLRLAGYEFIILDAPAALGSVDVRMIADLVDGTLFTAIKFKSKRSMIREAMESVQPSPMLGVVMMDA